MGAVVGGGVVGWSGARVRARALGEAEGWAGVSSWDVGEVFRKCGVEEVKRSSAW